MNDDREQLERDFPFLFENRSDEEKAALAETYSLGFYDVRADVEKMLQASGPPVQPEVYATNIDFLLHLLCKLCTENSCLRLYQRTVEAVNVASADSSPERYYEKKNLILAALHQVAERYACLGLVREAERRVDLLLEAAQHGKTAGEQRACWIYREPGLVLQLWSDGREQRGDWHFDLFGSIKLMRQYQRLEAELRPYLEKKALRVRNKEKIFPELKPKYPELGDLLSKPADIDQLPVGLAARTILGKRMSPPLDEKRVGERLRYARLTIEHATDPAAFVRKYREEFDA